MRKAAPPNIILTRMNQQQEKMICRILLLIILTSYVSGSFVVNVTQTCYQAEENHNITLEWTFTTKPDRSTKTLNILCELFISDEVSVLYQVHEGVEVSESQDEEFSGRVQSDKDALREGRIRLQLSRLRTDDSGLYLCEVNTDYGFSVGRCRLNVTAADQVQPQRSTLSGEVKSWGKTMLSTIQGLTALTAPLSAMLAAFIWFIVGRK
ncbi:uncharacterized protein LOC120740602 isoform X2 [Simochromis diagramma]|uniref:uncharacterized protein LOC120740602 isoform X2 n=1 Tax=Simochromis diagramma TaxID=43689 RepID=UPI001A7E5FE3|nr:uncharacterized protein LOC120740602 isoform X2 [Simochromis diagramma]